jgi:hypothetical protein
VKPGWLIEHAFLDKKWIRFVTRLALEGGVSQDILLLWGSDAANRIVP